MNRDNLNPLGDLTDHEILELIGNPLDFERGFRILMNKYQEKVYWHIRTMVDNHDDADDIIQNTFIKVFRSIERFEGKSRLYTWIYRIATNETLSFLKKNKKHVIISLSQQENFLESKQSDQHSPSAVEIQVKLQNAVAQLPDKQKKVFNMRYYDEMKYAEMSEILGTSVGALKASYHHAVKKIENILSDGE